MVWLSVWYHNMLLQLSMKYKSRWMTGPQTRCCVSHHRRRLKMRGKGNKGINNKYVHVFFRVHSSHWTLCLRPPALSFINHGINNQLTSSRIIPTFLGPPVSPSAPPICFSSVFPTWSQAPPTHSPALLYLVNVTDLCVLSVVSTW